MSRTRKQRAQQLRQSWRQPGPSLQGAAEAPLGLSRMGSRRLMIYWGLQNHTLARFRNCGNQAAGKTAGQEVPGPTRCPGLQCHHRTVPLLQQSLPILTQHMAQHRVLPPSVSLRTIVEQHSLVAASRLNGPPVRNS